MLEKVISGGQTGIDQMGLFIAEELKIPTGGTAAKGFRTEAGRAPWLNTRFGLVQSQSMDYPPRTKKNIMDSDGTVLFGNTMSQGSALTIDICKTQKRPCIKNPSIEQLVDWLTRNNIRVLNVAGNRGSRISQEALSVHAMVLRQALKEILHGQAIQ